MTDPTELDQMLDQALAPEVPELHAWLENPDPETGHYDERGAIRPAAVDEWRIEGPREAAWCARRIGLAEREIADAEAIAAAMRAEADEYVARVKRRNERSMAYFLGRLRLWHDGILAERPRALTVDLPGYQLKRRAGSVSTEVTDPDALVDWLTERDDDATFLEYPAPKVRKAALKDAFAHKVTADPGTYPAVDEATGEVIPGVAFVRAVPSETLVPVAPIDAEGSTE